VNATITPQQIESARQYPIVHLINTDGMKRESAVEYSGACPKCGGADRFRVNTQHNTWTCRQCLNLKWQDSIEWLKWHDGLEFREAITKLSGGGVVVPAVVKSGQKVRPVQWRDAQWQIDAQSEATEAAATLDGSQGADYLARRGIPLEVAERWRVGFATYQSQPSITLPYWGIIRGATVLKALQYRAINAGWRYKHKEGSERGLFGAWLCNPAVNKTLILCEGELNAISISVVAGVGCDVASFGSETPSKAILQSIKVLASRYALVIIWADEPENVQKVWEAAAGCLAIHGIKSLHKQDANDLLVLGRLGEYMQVVREVAYKKAGERIAMQYEKVADPALKTRLYEADERLIDAELQRFNGTRVVETVAA
jgi:hypothetical protein